MIEQNNQYATVIWIFSGLLAVFLLSFISYFIHKKHKPERVDKNRSETSQSYYLTMISDYFRDYYKKMRNQLSRSYNLMYSLSLEVDDILPDPVRKTDLRDLGIGYEEVKNIGYPYVAKLVNSENPSDWNMNLSKVHSIIAKIAEISVIESVLSKYSLSLKDNVRDELKQKSSDFSRECDDYPDIKEVLAEK